MNIVTNTNTYFAENRQDELILLLLSKQSQYHHDAHYWDLLAQAHFAEQNTPKALSCWQKCLQLDPNNLQFQSSYAKTRLLSGLPASDNYSRLCAVDQCNEEYMIGYAHALSLEGAYEQAIEALQQFTQNNHVSPNILKLLSDLFLLNGGEAAANKVYENAIIQDIHPSFSYTQIIDGYYHKEHYQQALEAVERATNALPNETKLAVKKAIILSEMHEDEAAISCFERLAKVQSVEKDLAILRMSLRKGNLNIAEAIAMHYSKIGMQSTFIPYLSLIWRLKNKTQFLEWLDRGNAFIKTSQIAMSNKELSSLGGLLEQLHTTQSPYLEQSVQGGTQTDLNLFLRQELIIQTIKERVKDQIKAYAQQLPVNDPTHPLLKYDVQQTIDGRIKFNGSWSVKLNPGGRNKPHTHPKGWLSSALYLQVPDKAKLGPEPNGFIQFGTPPANLNLPLSTTHQEAPEVGKLVLFPSTSWHHTVPFSEGKRLVIAFDVAAPEKNFAKK